MTKSCLLTFPETNMKVYRSHCVLSLTIVVSNSLVETLNFLPLISLQKNLSFNPFENICATFGLKLHFINI